MILILGRFQPLHKGHLKVIKDSYAADNDIVIAIGSSQKSDSKENPFSKIERERMIEAALKANSIRAKIVAVPDIADNSTYVSHVEEVIGVKIHKIVTESSWTLDLFKDAGYDVTLTPRYFGISGTEVRRLMANDGDWESIVPKEVAEVIRELKGADRVKRLFKN